MGYFLYKKGHQFNVISEDSMRGFDLEDDDGNMLCETRFVGMKLVDLVKARRKKLRSIKNINNEERI